MRGGSGHFAPPGAVYGVAHFGAIRAFGATAIMFASGLVPAAIGMPSDLQWSVSAIALSCAAYCVAASAIAVLGTSLRRG